MKEETFDEIVGRALRGEPYVPTGGGDDEPVAWLVCTEEGDPDMVFLDRLEACQYCEDDDPPKPLYLAAPPTAQAEGWQSIETAPKDGTRILLHPAVEVHDSWSKASWSAQNECWIVGGSPSGVLHTAWRPLPPPPTAEGVEHG